MKVQPKGPWTTERVCSVQYNGCGAVLQVAYADVTFEFSRCKRGTFVCPCCGMKLSIHVPYWAHKQAEDDGAQVAEPAMPGIPCSTCGRDS